MAVVAVVLANEAVEIEGEVIVEEGDEDRDVEETSLRRRNGSQSPSWADSSKPARSRAWSRSTYTPFPSKSIRSSIGSFPSSRTR